MDNQNKKIEELEEQISKLKREKLVLTIFAAMVLIIEIYDNFM